MMCSIYVNELTNSPVQSDTLTSPSSQVLKLTLNRWYDDSSLQWLAAVRGRGKQQLPIAVITTAD